MRAAALVIALSCAPAWADVRADRRDDAPADAVRVGAAIGAGGQGRASYGALELGVDVAWRGVRIGLGARGVWEDGVFRRRDWARAIDAVTLLRHLEARTEHVALAAGALAPAQLAHVADGYRQTLDDRLRTGVRGAVTTAHVQLGLEVDDVLAPVLVGGALAWQLAPPWGLHAGAAVDPTADGGARSALELGGSRRWDTPGRRLEAGAALVAEPRDGLGVLGFGSATLERGHARWTARADVRAGNGTNGAAFGPLHRVERVALLDQARAGVGGGLALSVAAPAGSLGAGVRARPGLGALVTLAGAAPMGRGVAAGGWIAASRDAAAGAAELRVAWARRPGLGALFSVLQVARMYATETNVMAPATSPSWSLTAWFGATTE